MFDLLNDKKEKNISWISYIISSIFIIIQIFISLGLVLDSDSQLLSYEILLIIIGLVSVFLMFYSIFIFLICVGVEKEKKLNYLYNTSGSRLDSTVDIYFRL